MKNIVKSRKEDAYYSSPFSRLPDEIILQVLNKLIDLKTLCFCYLVSRRFSSIVLQVDAISFSFTAPLVNPPIPDKNTLGDVGGARFLWKHVWQMLSRTSVRRPCFLYDLSVTANKTRLPLISSFNKESFRFLSAITFLRKFTGVKSLCIELPSSHSHIGIDNRCLFKWKVKIANQIKSFIFLSPNSVCDKDGFYLNGNRDEEKNIESVSVLLKQKGIAFQCVNEAILWHTMVLYFVKDLPMLEEVSITDSGRRGRLSLGGEKLSQVKNWVHSASALEIMRNHIENPDIASYCYIPLLNLPVSGYVMKGVNLFVMEMKDVQGEYDSFMNSEDDGFFDKEEAAYTEAVKEILEKHKGMIQRFM